LEAPKGENVALISGCRSDQTSSDAVFDSKANGALTRALLHELREPGGMQQPLVKLVNGVRRGLKQPDFDSVNSTNPRPTDGRWRR
jgi:hypothetical protein